MGPRKTIARGVDLLAQPCPLSFRAQRGTYPRDDGSRSFASLRMTRGRVGRRGQRRTTTGTENKTPGRWAPARGSEDLEVLLGGGLGRLRRRRLALLGRGGLRAALLAALLVGGLLVGAGRGRRALGGAGRLGAGRLSARDGVGGLLGLGFRRGGGGLGEDAGRQSDRDPQGHQLQQGLPHFLCSFQRGAQRTA